VGSLFRAVRGTLQAGSRARAPSKASLAPAMRHRLERMDPLFSSSLGEGGRRGAARRTASRPSQYLEALIKDWSHELRTGGVNEGIQTLQVSGGIN
jgi:hypothetical protein